MAGSFITSGLCVGSLLPELGAAQGLLVNVVCYVYDCSVLVLGGRFSNLWWEGGSSHTF